MKTKINVDEQNKTPNVPDMTAKSKKNKPSPEELLSEVKGRPRDKTYEFEDYVEVIHEMKSKDFSYARIAAYLSERLGYDITRGQVYRAYQLWCEMKDEEAREEAERKREAEEAAMPTGDEDDSGPDDPDSEEDEAAYAEAKAVSDVLEYAMRKYPAGALPNGLRGLCKRLLAVVDEEARSEFAAEESDKVLEGAKQEDAADES